MKKLTGLSAVAGLALVSLAFAVPAVAADLGGGDTSNNGDGQNWNFSRCDRGSGFDSDSTGWNKHCEPTTPGDPVTPVVPTTPVVTDTAAVVAARGVASDTGDVEGISPLVLLGLGGLAVSGGLLVRRVR